ncbi:MAG: VCBS repeat-containing protein [Candidatus Tectomicrobia bacterium]|uniref:VCBS repeat-containing protein n=1 Tax=Tectimicrobiota bacterium TaxID=2528274 RepID=A0A932CLR9_UNCTE|nr:VCBS repeat-containing protein [Candidatus Tectomicrobia bacterium]
MDMDGDGLSDRVYKETAGQIVWWRNTGSGFASSSIWTIPGEASFPKAKGLQDSELNASSKTVTYSDFLDLNGDGLPDRLYKDSADVVNVWLNTGSGFSGSVPWQIPDEAAKAGSSSAAVLRNEQIDFMDANNDGLPDRVLTGHEEGVWFWRNTGAGFSSPVLFGNWYEFRKYVNGDNAIDTVEDFHDINGDGLVDRVRKYATGGCSITAFLGDGRGGWHFVDYPLPAGTPACNTPLRRSSWNSLTVDEESCYLQKVNDDFLALTEIDADRHHFNASDRRFWVNDGKGFSVEVPLILPDDDQDECTLSSGMYKITTDSSVRASRKRVNLFEILLGYGAKNETISDFIDMNGDGLSDRIRKETAGSIKVLLRLTGTNNNLPSDTYLVKVTNALGGTSEYNYKPLDRSLNPGYKSKRWVVDTVTSLDGLGQSFTTRYEFHDGKYEADEREDRNFRKVVQEPF